MTDTPRIVLLFLGLTLVITLCLYFPGLSGGFIFDDAPRIRNNPLLAIDALEYTQLKQAFFSSADPFPSNRPLSMLSFGVNHALTGLHPGYFKLTNLVIHLWTGLAVFILIRLLVSTFADIRKLDYEPDRIAWLALAVSAAWMLHPINLTPALYVVQRMTSLSALFSIHAMICYVLGRRRMLGGKGGILWILGGFLLFGALAFMSKENAALLPLLLLTIELCLFRFATARIASRRFLISFFVLTVGVPAVGFLVYVALNPGFVLGGYTLRDFSLTERLMTEARILWFYLRLIFIPTPASLGFFHDDIVVSRGLLEPVTTLPALLGLGVLTVIAFYSRTKAPVLSFGILFFLVGHALESTVFPLELAFEHRNYLPSMGPLLSLFYYLMHPLASRSRRMMGLILGGVFLACISMVTADRASYWGDLQRLYLTEVEHHPASARANFLAGAVYVEHASESPDAAEAYRNARHHMEMATQLNPHNSKGLFGLIILHLYTNKPVLKEWLDELEYRLENNLYIPENINATQFKALVESQRKHGVRRLSEEKLLRIFNAAFRNPTMRRPAQAALYSVLHDYYQHVLHRPTQALHYARLAVATWPWYPWWHSQLVDLLLELNQIEAARKQVSNAERLDKGARFAHEFERLKGLIKATEADLNK